MFRCNKCETTFGLASLCGNCSEEEPTVHDHTVDLDDPGSIYCDVCWATIIQNFEDINPSDYGMLQVEERVG